MVTVLIVDDEDKLRTLLKRIIGLEGYKVFDVQDIKTARTVLDTQSIDIVLCDVMLGDGNGVVFTKEVKEKHPMVEVILLTAHGNIPDGVQAIKNGAFDYIVKGNDNDKIIPLLSRAAEKVSLQTRVNRLEKQLNKQYSFDGIIGECPLIKDAVKLAQQVAPTDAAVLLTGETGTGKEVFAQAIHYNSNRSKFAFVALNCSSFSKDILESELFGHKAGAFTGAVKDKKGLVEEAKNGTLFLDEIGEMPLELQPKMLRLLENGTYIRVGDTKEMQANVRIVAATNRNLLTEISENHFRRDLYYRIAVFTIELPALRDRKKDIPLLVMHFLQVYASKINKNINSVSLEAMDALVKCDWKGNTRELKNILERAVILEPSQEITLNSLPFELQHFAVEEGDNAQSPFRLAFIEKQHIQKMLQYTGGNKSETAKLLDIGLATLYRKIEEYKLKV